MALASHYKQILDNLLTATIVLDVDLQITFVNTSAEILLSVSGDQVLGKHVSHSFSDVDGSPDAFREALADNRHFTMRRARWRLHNNSEITVDYSVSPNPELAE